MVKRGGEDIIIRKSLITILIVFLALLFASKSRPWIVPNTYVSGWGAGSTGVAPNSNISIQKVSFNATILNNGHYPVYVKEVQVIFSEPYKSNFKSGNQTLSVKKWLKPKETTTIHGEWFFDSSAMKEFMVGSHVTFKVKTFPF